MIRVTPSNIVPMELSPEEWAQQMAAVRHFTPSTAARITAHVAALEERIQKLEQARDQVPGPGVRRFTR